MEYALISDLHDYRILRPHHRTADSRTEGRQYPSTPQKRQITMINADLKTNGSKLTITVDLSKEHGPCKSGKTLIIATSSGNQKIEGTDAIIGLNIYRKR